MTTSEQPVTHLLVARELLGDMIGLPPDLLVVGPEATVADLAAIMGLGTAAPGDYPLQHRASADGPYTETPEGAAAVVAISGQVWPLLASRDRRGEAFFHRL